MKRLMLFDNFGKYFHKNIWLHMICLVCFCSGIVIGTYTIKYMGNIDKNVLLQYLNSFTEQNANQISGQVILVQTIGNNLPFILAIWFLGLTIVGIPLVLIIDLVKGFTFGFSISFIISTLGKKGIYFVLLEIMPQNIIYIPCLIVASVMAMEFSIVSLKNKFEKRQNHGLGTRVTKYSICFLLVIVIMFAGFLIESFVVTGFVKYILTIS